MKKHGIGILCYPTLGGSARVATELAGALASAGHPVHLLSYETPQGLPSVARAPSGVGVRGWLPQVRDGSC